MHIMLNAAKRFLLTDQQPCCATCTDCKTAETMNQFSDKTWHEVEDNALKMLECTSTKAFVKQLNGFPHFISQPLTLITYKFLSVVSIKHNKNIGHMKCIIKTDVIQELFQCFDTVETGSQERHLACKTRIPAISKGSSLVWYGMVY